MTPALISKQQDLQSVVRQFELLMQQGDSPIRAIRRQPALSGDFRDVPDSVHPSLKAALHSRGIAKLYSHQAAAAARR